MFSYLVFAITQNNDAGSYGGNDWLSSIGQFFSLLIVFALILVGAYYATKWLAKTRYNLSKASNIKLLESLSVGAHHFLYLVKVGEKILLIGVTKDKISLIADVSDASIEIAESEVKKTNRSFENMLLKVLSKYKKGDGNDE